MLFSGGKKCKCPRFRAAGFLRGQRWSKIVSFLTDLYEKKRETGN